MGASSSLPNSPRAPRRSRYPGLSSTGRLTTLRSPRGGVVHILGVFPCSTHSEEEAADLISATSPGAVYVDVSPELLRLLSDDVAAGRTTALGGAWRVPEKSPPFSRVAGAGWLVSMNLRTILADNQMFGLMGAELFGAFKAALAAANAVKARVVPFPFEMEYNNGITLMRPAETSAVLIGDSSVGSTRITALIGNPNAWQYVSETPEKNIPQVEFELVLPPEGYFTRADADARRAAFRSRVNSALLSLNAEKADVDADLNEREAEVRSRGDPASGDLLHERAMTAQAHASAIAWTLQEAADAEVLAAEGAVEGSPTAGKKTATIKPVVAIVSLGSVGALKRNWDSAAPPMQCIPPLTLTQHAIGYAVPAAVLLPLGYATYRAARRFPKTTAFFGVVVGSGLGTLAYSTMHGDWTRYGSTLRSALAMPRVTSPLARINR